MQSIISSIKTKIENEKRGKEFDKLYIDLENFTNTLLLSDQHIDYILAEIGGFDKEKEFVLQTRLKQIRKDFKIGMGDLHKFNNMDQENFISAIVNGIIGFFKAIINFILGLFGGGSSGGGGGGSSAPSANDVIKEQQSLESHIEETEELINKADELVNRKPEIKDNLDTLKEKYRKIGDELKQSILEIHIMSNIIYAVCSQTESILNVKDVTDVQVDVFNKIIDLLKILFVENEIDFNYDIIEYTKFNKILYKNNEETVLPIGVTDDSYSFLVIKYDGLYKHNRQISSVSIEKLPVVIDENNIKPIKEIYKYVDSKLKEKEKLYGVLKNKDKLLKDAEKKYESRLKDDKFKEELIEYFEQVIYRNDNTRRNNIKEPLKFYIGVTKYIISAILPFYKDLKSYEDVKDKLQKNYKLVEKLQKELQTVKKELEDL